MEWDHVLGTSDFRDDPYPYYRQLQQEDPVHWNHLWGCWILTRYEDVVTVLQNHRRFSNRGRVTNVIRKDFPEAFLEQIRPLLSHFDQGLINVDPPDHTRLRRLVQKTFLPRTLDRLRPHVGQIVDDLLDRAAPAGEMDVVRDLAYPLPVTVIAELLGVPTEMRQPFKEWSAAILEFQATPRPSEEVLHRSQKALLECRDYMAEMARERRRFPKSDLLSEMVAVEEEGDRLSHEELLSTSVGLLVAGHETTTNLIASTIWLLATHPDQRKVLDDHPETLESAVEEALRFESPLQRLGRTVTEETAIHGRPVREGETVLSLLGAANRDPAVFADPDRFDIRRSPNRHIAFGQGVHFCLGAPLARLEAPIALQRFLDRCPAFEPKTERLQWNSGVMRGPAALPIRF